jgi:ADP-ribose pyrophosphatase
VSFHRFIRDGEGWGLIDEQIAFDHPHLKVALAKVRTPSRPDGASWAVVHRKGAVVVAPMTADGSFVLIRQERVPIRQTLWEFPAGQVEERMEHSPAVLEAAALRELEEESGYAPAPGAEVLPLGHYFTSPGLSDEHCHLFLVRPVAPAPSGPRPDSGEAILGATLFTPADLRAAIANGSIIDANTLAAFARLSARGLI